MNDSNQNKSRDFPDDAVRRFLLGQLTADEQPDFEQGLFLDSELEERVRLAEFDLADNYAYLRLSAEDRERFEERFLTAADRKVKLNVSNALRDRFAYTQAPVGMTTRLAKQLHSLFNVKQPTVRIAFGVLMMVVIVGGAWLLIKKEPQIKQGIKRIAKIRRSQPTNAPQEEAHHPRREASTVEIVTLWPDVLLESGKAPSINLPAGAHDIVRLELVVEPDPSALYKAQLSTIDGQTVVTAESVKATEALGKKIDFDIPVGLLKSGDYRITLTKVNDTSKETVASYYFRVR